jgi:hypothetical protein
MRRFSTFCLFGALMTSLFSMIGCRSGPTEIPANRPGDFRLGVVVMNPDDDAQGTHQDARYIVDSALVLRASFGAGSSLDTFPGYTRRLDHDQMDAVWLMVRNLLESQRELIESGSNRLHAGQPLGMIDQNSGIIVEIHLNSSDEVYAFGHQDQRAAAIVDALSELAWVDTTPNKVPDQQAP